MRTTPTTTARRIAGLLAVPALVLTAAACGDDDEGNAAGFCDQVRDIDEQMTDTDLDPETMSGLVEAMAAVDAPDDIADDWATMTEGFEMVAEVDLTDPEQAANAEFDEAQLDAADEASGRVTDYVDEECGFSIAD